MIFDIHEKVTVEKRPALSMGIVPSSLKFQFSWIQWFWWHGGLTDDYFSLLRIGIKFFRELSYRRNPRPATYPALPSIAFVLIQKTIFIHSCRRQGNQRFRIIDSWLEYLWFIIEHRTLWILADCLETFRLHLVSRSLRFPVFYHPTCFAMNCHVTYWTSPFTNGLLTSTDNKLTAETREWWV